MKHLRKFEKHRNLRKSSSEVKTTVNESVLQVNDIYKVRVLVDVPQSLVNSYVKKAKDELGKNVRQFYGDMDIAEELVKNVVMSGLTIDTIPATSLVGGEVPQAQGQAQGQTQTQPEEQAQAQVQPQGQGQAQVQVQTEPQGQAQGQGQAQPQGEFEEVEEEEEEKEEGEGEEELPI